MHLHMRFSLPVALPVTPELKHSALELSSASNALTADLQQLLLLEVQTNHDKTV